ncbi:dimethylsulfonioproprionate lyase family protein [Pelagibius marinus]|uniref:dimethylsulfonioproprionate lyase family protein n=1 Tax=Pelagibius marinus TaxID=2762760 RepID=UPI001872C15A|nr:dimethylsulfonioproprionate lyase family protein [Pelagibius marinus]
MTETAQSFGRLNDHAEWRYLLREFELAYRHGQAGGSSKIRAHMKEVRLRLAAAIKSNSSVLECVGQRLPVCAHLHRALDNGMEGAMRSLVRTIEVVADRLDWRYGYDRLPKGLEKKYGFAEFLGPQGPVVCNDLTLGVVLFAPQCTYPAHKHDGITESYICLSGAASENDSGVYTPRSMILNLPGHTHRITTSDHEPVLLAYAWAGSADSLARPEMNFKRK